MTITAAGDGSYYIGDEIKLTGTNTDSSNIFLFITGPNLKTNGEVLKELPNHKFHRKKMYAADLRCRFSCQ